MYRRWKLQPRGLALPHPKGANKGRSSLAILLLKINRYSADLSLTLFVSRVCITNDSHHALASHNLAVPTNFLY
jgi:hypothetical protein